MFRNFAPDDCATANDLAATFAYNPASQITTNVRTGDAYAWTQHFNQNVTGTPNGLNQLTAVGPKTLTHDTKGNVTAFGTKSFTYSSENLLLTGPGSTSLSYDGLMRLRRVVAGGATTNLVYDGLDRIAEVSSSVIQSRYVHGPGMDEPLVWYEGSGTADRRFLSSDERGSIVSVTNSTGALLAINRYDEYGQPQGTNLGVFGYTGQAWLPSLGAWYYKARVDDPELGRFVQPDPIGYADGANLYPYVANDPVNWVDPSGTTYGPPRSICAGAKTCGGLFFLQNRDRILSGSAAISTGFGDGGSWKWVEGSVGGTNEEIIVTGGHYEWVPGVTNEILVANWGGFGHNNPPLTAAERLLRVLRRSPLLIIHHILVGKSANVAVDLLMNQIVASRGVDQSERAHHDYLIGSGSPQTDFASMAQACGCTIAKVKGGAQSFNAGPVTYTLYTSGTGIQTISRFYNGKITHKLRYP